jgi:glutamate dehydrogenase
MKVSGARAADRVEAFVAAIDTYEPRWVSEHEDAFRVFARFVSRSLDGRYLERHPPQELLPEIEQMMATAMLRTSEEVRVRFNLIEETAGRRAVLITNMEDQRFLYSVLRLSLESLGVRVCRSLNSLVPLARNASGLLTGVGSSDAIRESIVWVEIEADHLETRQKEIEDHVRGRLEAARVAVNDFSKLTAVMQGLVEQFEELGRTRPDHRQLYEDNARIVKWLLADHFVMLGMRYIPREGVRPLVPVENLGVGRYNDWRQIRIERAEQDVFDAGGIPPFFWIRKSHTESWIYRSGRTDHVLIQCFSAEGHPAGLLVIEGLFSYPALAEPRTSVPLLDRIIDNLYAQLKATKGSHRYRTIRNAFNSLPLEYLFSLQPDDVCKLVEQVLDVDIQNRLQVHITADALQNTAFVFVALPRSHYSDELRADILKLLKERFRASSVDSGVYAGNVDSVTFHYFLTGVASLADKQSEQLHADIELMASPWSDRLLDALLEAYGNKQGRHLHALYSEAFPSRYREETSIARAVADIRILEDLAENKKGALHFDCDIYREKGDAELGVARLRLFQTDQLLLSDILPVLDHLGLIVIDQFPTSVQVPGRKEQVIATFRIRGVQGMQLDVVSRKNRLRDAVCAVVTGAMSNDPLNRLLLRADIPWNYVVLMRSYLHYARQIGFPYGAATVQEALLGHGHIVRSLTEMFRVKFDPDMEGLSARVVEEKRLAFLERSRKALLLQLDSVEDLTSDEVLRTFYHLMEATLRTNFYARDPMTHHQLVLKFDPSSVKGMPEPKPYREIYVNHPLVEGLHLRGGPVARGGIRWSDRLMDYRTEVLSLMATQNLKNVLIVPRGAKGAFVLRHPPADLAERRAHADEMYKIFIGGCLEVADNWVNGKVVTPSGVLAHDGPDPYFVVAADKGTAHLSDTANSLAAAGKFWLGDAFASGGSKGYDHKKEAITARGAWVCVRRHFGEMGLDPEKDVITVAGIGDMSGDVFGNGLLRSKTVKLVAAFDHRHIFIDPQPDPAKSYEARLALFKKPRSSWADYPAELISQGGGVYPRSAKSVKLSEALQQMLGVTAESLSGPELVRAILKMPVDLLWNGGIGTYIKATTETHQEAGDASNDSVRVDATEVRAKVIGEGGNLGITQTGRVELASRGIRLNTDAVDNSAGVDLSDHEVNLKILLQAAMGKNLINPDQRDALLEQYRVEIGNSVEMNNWIQSRMLSMDDVRSRRDPSRFLRAMVFLGERVPFKRRESYLPGERVLKQRALRGEGLYRPELAVMCANAKLDLKQELVHTQVFDVKKLEQELLEYFPASLRKKFEEEIKGHPLGIDIARTVLTNNVIADVGCTFFAEMTAMTGSTTDEVLLAYLAASNLCCKEKWIQTWTKPSVSLPMEHEYHARLCIEDAIEEVVYWMLSHPEVSVEQLGKSFAQVWKSIAASSEAHTPWAKALLEAGVAQDAVLSMVALCKTADILDVVAVVLLTGEKPQRALWAMDCMDQHTGLRTLIAHALHSTSTEDLDRPARMSVKAQLRQHSVALAQRVLASEKGTPSECGEGLKKLFEAMRRDLGVVKAEEQPLCNLLVASERIRRNVRV